jgi:hypothetical protein
MYHQCFLEEQAVLLPREYPAAALDMDEYLLLQLRKKMEGRCSPHGFIKENSMKMLSRTLGQGKNGTFTGDFTFRCKLQCDVLYPAVDDLIPAEVLKVNKMGAYAAFENSLRVLLPRDLHLGNLEFDALKEGNKITVRILKIRFQSHDDFIMAVGLLENVVDTAQSEGSLSAPTLSGALSARNGSLSAPNGSLSAPNGSLSAPNGSFAPVLEQ